MLDIKQEIGILLLKRGTSMKKVVERAAGTEKDIPSASTISIELSSKRIRFETVQDILDSLGADLIIREREK